MSRRSRRRRLIALAVLALVLAAWDLSRPPAAQRLARVAIAAIHGYQHGLAPLVARTGVRCHFTPSCSRYAEAVIGRHGLVGGGWRAIGRVARCGPWTPMGVVDPPR